MRVLIATDAWHPQVNGVVRTLTSLARSAKNLGVDVEFLSPDGFPTMPLPTYPGLRLALPSRRKIAQRIESAKPDAIHIATEGPIGHRVRAYCLRRNWPFTTSYTTRFPEYISARWPIPEGLIYAGLRRFHSAASVTMIATPSLEAELRDKGFRNLGRWTRGVDTDLFRPERAIELPLPPPGVCLRRPRRGREEPRSVSLARPARHQDRHRHRPAGGRAASSASPTRNSSA